MPILLASPPRTAACFQHEFVASPMAQVGRVRDPDVGAKRSHGPVDQSPVSVNPAPARELRLYRPGA